MSRVKRGVTAHARHKKVLKAAKGYYGRRKNTIRVAKQAVKKPANTLTATARPRSATSARCGSSASTPRPASTADLRPFIDGLNKAGIEVDRKVLSDLAINQPDAFKALVEKAQGALAA
jgi:large subunit ribosomal protein L20